MEARSTSLVCDTSERTADPDGSPHPSPVAGSRHGRPMIRQVRSNARDDDLLTVADAALIAHRSVRTLRRAYLAGRLVAHRDGNGRGVTIRYAGLLAWLTTDVVRPVPAAARCRSRSQPSTQYAPPKAPVETGNLELLSAARRQRATHD